MADIIACPACGARNRVRADIRGVPLCGKCKQPLPVTARVRPRVLKTEDFESSLRLNPQPMLVDFWAQWCMPCRTLAPELEKFAAAHPEITVAKVDIEAEPGLASQFEIFGVPTLVLFIKGREEHRVSGAMSVVQLEEAFRPWLAKE
jgi:thioredoxin 2